MSFFSTSKVPAWRRAAWAELRASTLAFAGDVGHGLREFSHNALAMVGLLIVSLIAFASGHSDARHALEARTLSWLQARQEARLVASGPAVVSEPEFSEPDAVARATAADPKDLSRAQASVALWLARRYHVAPEPVSRLVQEAWTVGEASKLDPTLILAVMAVESNFNPFAQSAVGAQGLMQVMTKVHDAKYEAFGGSLAAFDPVTNLRVGVQVLKECIGRGGSVEAGLRAYVGAGNSGEDGGYAAKVLAEQNTLRLVASGVKIRTAVVAATPPRPHVDPGDGVPATPAAAPTESTPATPEQVALLR